MTTFGNIFAAGKRYDVVDAGSNQVAKFALNGTYYGTRLSANQTAGGVSFTVKGVAYVVNPTATSGAAKIKLGSTIYYIVVAAGAPTPSPIPTPTPTDSTDPITFVPVDPAVCGLKGAAVTTTFKGTTIPAGRYVGVHFAGQFKIVLKPGEKIECVNCTADGLGNSYCFDCTENLGDFSFQHGELGNVSSAFVVGSHYTVRFNKCRGSKGDASKASQYGIFDSNDVKGLGGGGVGVAHGDVMQIRAGSYNQCTRNYCDCQNDAESNSLFFCQLDGHDNLCAGNFYSGGNFPVHCYDSTKPGTNRIIVNVFKDQSYKYGPLGMQAGTIHFGNKLSSGKLLD